MRLLFSPKLLVLAMVAVAAVPELAKKCKPAARAVGDGIVKLGEALKDIGKPDEESEKVAASAPPRERPAEAPQSATASKPAASKPAAKKAKSPAAKKPAAKAKTAKPAAKKPKTS